jgi:hypothetical protein
MSVADFARMTAGRFKIKAAHGLGKLRGGGGSGTAIFDREGWDICVVLDALRYDLAADYFDGVEPVRSVASTSKRWVPRTYGDRTVASVGVVTGNPLYERLNADRFAHFHQAEMRAVAGVRTIPPGDILAAAVGAWRDRQALGIEQLVVHAMQPHSPFRSRPAWFDSVTDGFGSSIWRRAGVGDVAPEALWAAYRDNLRWVDGALVQPLLNNVDATVAITADHGNAHGEAGCWGHPAGVDIPALRRVPWLTRQGHDGGTVAGQRPNTEPDTDAQLEALGYR